MGGNFLPLLIKKSTDGLNGAFRSFNPELFSSLDPFLRLQAPHAATTGPHHLSLGHISCTVLRQWHHVRSSVLIQYPDPGATTEATETL